MKYLKVFTDFAEILEPLQDAEVGRLFKSMLAYAETGAAPDLRGNEKFVWNAAKQIIDRERGYSERQTENGKKGGRPKNPQKPNESQQNPQKPNESPKDKDKDKDYKEILPNGSTKKAAAASFRPPTVEEVQTYCTERGNSVNAEAFVDYYAARGWCLSNGVKVKDWRACVRTWENRDKERGKKNRALQYSQSPIPAEAEEQMTVRFDKYGSQNFPQKAVHMDELDNIIGGDRE